MPSLLQTQCWCFLGPDTCSLCCSFFPPIKQSTSTKLMYTLIMLFAVIVFYVILAPEFQTFLSNYLHHINATCVKLNAGSNCEELSGYLAVYKGVFVMVVFHFTLMIVTIRVRNSNNFRADIHNGFWGLKFCFLLGFSLVTFHLPSNDLFGTVWMSIGMLGGALFILIQLLFIVNHAQRLQEKWTRRVEDTEDGLPDKSWLCALYFFNAFLLLLLCGIVVLLLMLYTKHGSCYENKIFIGLNATLCLIMCIFTLIPFIRKGKNVGLLGGSLVSLYILYITWSAIANEPETKDFSNSTFSFSDLFSPLNKTTDQWVTCAPSLTKNVDEIQKGKDFMEKWKRAYEGLGTAFMFIMAIVSSIKISTKAHRIGISKNVAADEVYCDCCPRNVTRRLEDRSGQVIEYDDDEHVTYNYSFFHFVYMLAAFYIMLQLTNWFNPKKVTSNRLGLNWLSVSIKMGTTWLCFILFSASVLCPSCMPTAIGSVMHNDGKDFVVVDGSDPAVVDGSPPDAANEDANELGR